jgi:hypothetical protein
MAFRFETANERWGHYKESGWMDGSPIVDPNNVDDKTLNSITESFARGWSVDDVMYQLAQATWWAPMPSVEVVQYFYDQYHADTSNDNAGTFMGSVKRWGDYKKSAEQSPYPFGYDEDRGYSVIGEDDVDPSGDTFALENLFQQMTQLIQSGQHPDEILDGIEFFAQQARSYANGDLDGQRPDGPKDIQNISKTAAWSSQEQLKAAGQKLNQEVEALRSLYKTVQEMPLNPAFKKKLLGALVKRGEQVNQRLDLMRAEYKKMSEMIPQQAPQQAPQEDDTDNAGTFMGSVKQSFGEPDEFGLRTEDENGKKPFYVEDDWDPQKGVVFNVYSVPNDMAFPHERNMKFVDQFKTQEEAEQYVESNNGYFV